MLRIFLEIIIFLRKRTLLLLIEIQLAYFSWQVFIVEDIFSVGKVYPNTETGHFRAMLNDSLDRKRKEASFLRKKLSRNAAKCEHKLFRCDFSGPYYEKIRNGRSVIGGILAIENKGIMDVL